MMFLLYKTIPLVKYHFKLLSQPISVQRSTIGTLHKIIPNLNLMFMLPHLQFFLKKINLQIELINNDQSSEYQN